MIQINGSQTGPHLGLHVYVWALQKCSRAQPISLWAMKSWYIDGLVQDCSLYNCALAMEIVQPCTKPSIYCWKISICSAWKSLAHWGTQPHKFKCLRTTCPGHALMFSPFVYDGENAFEHVVYKMAGKILSIKLQPKCLQNGSQNANVQAQYVDGLINLLASLQYYVLYFDQHWFR